MGPFGVFIKDTECIRDWKFSHTHVCDQMRLQEGKRLSNDAVEAQEYEMAFEFVAMLYVDISNEKEIVEMMEVKREIGRERERGGGRLFSMLTMSRP